MVIEYENWCQTPSQVTGIHFLEVNPNSYDISNMKLDLNISTKVKSIAKDYGI